MKNILWEQNNYFVGRKKKKKKKCFHKILFCSNEIFILFPQNDIVVGIKFLSMLNYVSVYLFKY